MIDVEQHSEVEHTAAKIEECKQFMVCHKLYKYAKCTLFRFISLFPASLRR